MRRSLWHWLSVYGPLFTWLFCLVWMVQNYLSYPPQPDIVVPDAEGNNLRGELPGNILFSCIELAAFYWLLRPWASSRFWRRVILTLVVFFPWMVLWLFLSLHSGGITFVRWLWLLLLNLGLLLTSLALLVRTIYRR